MFQKPQCDWFTACDVTATPAQAGAPGWPVQPAERPAAAVSADASTQ